MGTASSGTIEDLRQFSIAAHAGGKDSSGTLAVLQDGGAGAVAEEDAGVPVGPVDDAGKLVRADHKHCVVGAGGNVLTGCLDPEEEAGAGGRDVEADGVHRPDLGLHEAGGVREEHVRRAGRANDQVDGLHGDPCILDGGQCRLRSEIAGGLLGSGDATLPDAGARLDPLVTRLDQFLKIGVCHHAIRSVAAGSDDGCGAQGLRLHGRPPRERSRSGDCRDARPRRSWG